MPRILTLTANLLAETTYSYDAWSEGMTQRARSEFFQVGGKGINVTRMLIRLGVDGIRLLDEIEPGIPLGLTLGSVSVPVVTKAGGFGDEKCLERIIARLRFIKQTGTVA